MKRALVSELSSVTVMIASFFLIYRCVEFLAEKDYVAGLIAGSIGVILIRASAEFGRYAAFRRGDP